jgi:hypothetical protein
MRELLPAFVVVDVLYVLLLYLPAMHRVNNSESQYSGNFLTYSQNPKKEKVSGL